MFKDKVTLECFTKSYPCLRDGGTWNGWLEPYMTKETVIEVMRELKENLTEEESDVEILGDFQWIVDNFGKGVFKEIDGIEYADVSLGLCWDN